MYRIQVAEDLQEDFRKEGFQLAWFVGREGNGTFENGGGAALHEAKEGGGGGAEMTFAAGACWFGHG